ELSVAGELGELAFDRYQPPHVLDLEGDGRAIRNEVPDAGRVGIVQQCFQCRHRHLTVSTLLRPFLDPALQQRGQVGRVEVLVDAANPAVCAYLDHDADPQ